MDSYFNQRPSTETVEALEDSITWSVIFEEQEEAIAFYLELRKLESGLKSHYYSTKNERARLLQRIKPLQKYRWQ